jgi:hypothetical protein
MASEKQLGADHWCPTLFKMAVQVTKFEGLQRQKDSILRILGHIEHSVLLA